QPHVETFGKTNVCTVYDELFAMEVEYDCSYEGSIMTRVSREDGSVQILEITMVSEDEFDAYVVEGKNAEITYHYASYYKTGDDSEKDKAF
ncbi:MAG: hypothetical protein IKL97_03475, partial [Eggerthellaceae bacterium]|nr:hypothetical protein [Eggerthellaceae bacterium]